MLPTYTITKECDQCHKDFTGTRFGEDSCMKCRRVLALERIAEVLEHWVGML